MTATATQTVDIESTVNGIKDIETVASTALPNSDKPSEFTEWPDTETVVPVDSLPMGGE